MMIGKWSLGKALAVLLVSAICLPIAILGLNWDWFPFGEPRISMSDRSDAVAFCEELLPVLSSSNFSGHLSFDELPTEFQSKAPKAVRGIEFRVWSEVDALKCCFKSIKPGDWEQGYVDCVISSGGDGNVTTLVTNKSIVFWFDVCRQSELSKGARTHAYEGKSKCARIHF